MLSEEFQEEGKPSLNVAVLETTQFEGEYECETPQTPQNGIVIPVQTQMAQTVHPTQVTLLFQQYMQCP